MARLIPLQEHALKLSAGTVLTIGNFDGLHIGHQTLLRRLVAIGNDLGCATVVATFDPHPKTYFAPEAALPTLSSLRDKACALKSAMVDYLCVLPFNQKMAMRKASEFVRIYLKERLHAKYLLIGDDFRFGYKREGDVALLESLKELYCFEVETMPTVMLQGERVSSTSVRAALQADDLPKAERLLGHPYRVCGRVRRGDALGRELGFPTLNLRWQGDPPMKGVYVVRVYGIGEKPLEGVASLGTRPTVGGVLPLLEVHLFKFSEEIYGRIVQVEFCLKIRDEQHFADLSALRDAIASDAEIAKTYFKE